MKRVSFCIGFFLVIIFFSLTGCGVHHAGEHTSGDNTVAGNTITIDVVDIDKLQPNKLILKVNGVVYPADTPLVVDKNDKIQWVVADSSGVESIEDIDKKKNKPSDDIFTTTKPAPQASKKHWKINVKGNAKNNAKYYYNITWIPKALPGVQRVYDPVVAIRP